MTTYIIPKVYIPGFENIAKLDDDELRLFAKIISDMEVGENPENIVINASNKLPSFSEDAIRDMVRSLVSLVDIFETAGRDIEIFTTGFAESYILSNPKASREDVVVIKKNLSSLLEKYDSIRITSKIRDVIFENQNNLKHTRIVSDIRLVFDENLENEKKYSVVVHSLKLEYTSGEESKEFFVAMDLSDLKKMKDVLERAIEKDRIIRENKYVLNFIDI
jgi:hypothetical protein